MRFDYAPALKMSRIEPTTKPGFFGADPVPIGTEYFIGSRPPGWYSADASPTWWVHVGADARVEIHELLSIEDAARAFLNAKWDDNGFRMTIPMLRALCGNAPDDATARLFWQALARLLATDTTA